MSGRPKIFKKEEILKKAEAIFWSKGYEVTSTEDLLKTMGIGKGSFYLEFKRGKKELFEEVLRSVSERELMELKYKLQQSTTPIKTLKNHFRNISLASAQTNANGCLFGNTIMEFSNVDESLKYIAVEHLEALENIFKDVVTDAKSKGELKTEIAPALLAKHLITIWNGLGITRRMTTNQEDLMALIEMQLKIIE
ncbi:TetR/AcrR family transcriptional regulator [Flavobacterium sp. '19STA2R22 D10 B1']|uniref:TetR/AcrR family transcriptional regulator n=1 Tax=Flavobacterium aerium TaxID=3037261 RepID=UPI00278BCE8A|nr:TetR/AcrR family transcriptional regulator [Flavobacterium sp. '19STA2R22 D10 B1']